MSPTTMVSWVLTTVENHVATVLLNRPQALNAIDTEMRLALQAAWQRIASDDDIHVAIACGDGTVPQMSVIPACVTAPSVPAPI